MKKDNVVRDKSYAFALQIIRLYQYLCNEKKEYVLSKQILRCGTSIGANIEEAIGGQSKSDVFAKLTIAYKEARETHYWLRSLTDSNYLEPHLSQSLITECHELLRLIGSIKKTMKTTRNS